MFWDKQDGKAELVMGQYYLASGYSHGQKDDMVLFWAEGSGKMEIVSTYRQGDSPSFLCTMGKGFMQFRSTLPMPLLLLMGCKKIK